MNGNFLPTYIKKPAIIVMPRHYIFARNFTNSLNKQKNFKNMCVCLN